jgi:hypothetical protein
VDTSWYTEIDRLKAQKCVQQREYTVGKVRLGIPECNGSNIAALSFASRDPMTVAPGGLAIFLGRLTPPPIMWPRLRNVKRGTLFVLAARTDPSIMTLLLCKNRSFNFQRPMLDQTHPHTHIPYQTRFQACVFSNGASGRLSQQSIPDMAVSGQEVATWKKVGPEERIGGVGLLKHDRMRWQGL